MKTQTIRSNEMTLQPFFGRRANQTTHNLTGAASASTVATTHDHKEATMKNKRQSEMNLMNSLLQKLARIAPKAALLAIVAVSFVLSPMAFADCSFSPSAVTLYAAPGQGVGSDFTISGISETWLSEGWVTAKFFVSGDFTGSERESVRLL